MSSNQFWLMKQKGEIVIYQSAQGAPTIQVLLENDTLWLDQYQISELFDTDRTSIVRHIQNIYSTSELEEGATCAKITQVQQEGERTVKRQIKIFNLDLIISVGYRVNSKQGTAFDELRDRQEFIPLRCMNPQGRVVFFSSIFI